MSSSFRVAMSGRITSTNASRVFLSRKKNVSPTVNRSAMSSSASSPGGASRRRRRHSRGESPLSDAVSRTARQTPAFFPSGRWKPKRCSIFPPRRSTPVSALSGTAVGNGGFMRTLPRRRRPCRWIGVPCPSAD
ncbi:hypothetical protein SDC9_125749 [bioreactor metagenome]|uniref:Uncharacterized protein n=1 Tax=bioreactor metagenome TaxID=1076179 RepID=A0A645CPB3_9ZZZZ